MNWECPSYFTLGGNDFIIVGSEGKWADRTTYENQKVPSWQIWLSGRLRETENGSRFDKTSEGIVDWGNYYAAQTFTANDGRTLNIGQSLPFPPQPFVVVADMASKDGSSIMILMTRAGELRGMLEPCRV